MNLFRKLALAGVGFAFIFTLAVTESYGQYYRSRSWSPYRTYTATTYTPRYSRYRYNRSNRMSWRERRRLARARARMIRATQRYYRTRARVSNRRAYRNAYYPRTTYYRNW
jgi:hypothetical protein